MALDFRGFFDVLMNLMALPNERPQMRWFYEWKAHVHLFQKWKVIQPSKDSRFVTSLNSPELDDHDLVC